MILSANDDLKKRELSIGELETVAGGFLGIFPIVPLPTRFPFPLNPHPHHPLPPHLDFPPNLGLPFFGGFL